MIFSQRGYSQKKQKKRKGKIKIVVLADKILFHFLSDIPDNTGGVEEVNVEEDENDEFEIKDVRNNKGKKKENNNINNDETGASVELNSELEYDSNRIK